MPNAHSEKPTDSTVARRPSLRFGELTSPQAGEACGTERPVVALLPLGAIEPHGPHAPLATDVIIASGICERAARALEQDDRVGALLLPAIPYGVTRYGRAFPGAIHVSEETLRRLIVEIGIALGDNGLHRLALVNHHFEPEQVATARRAAEDLRGLGVRAELLDLTRRRLAQRLTDEFRMGSCHAGRYETSLVLSDRPELVDVETMRALPPVEVDMPDQIAEGRTDFVAMGMDAAYCGTPHEASEHEGDQTYDVLSQMLVELIRELAQEEHT